jgi:hypothetical protein
MVSSFLQNRIVLRFTTENNICPCKVSGLCCRRWVWGEGEHSDLPVLNIFSGGRELKIRQGIQRGQT